MSTHAWIRACSETRWHITHSHNSGLALHALCGHTIWAPVHRRLSVPPVDAEHLCEACHTATNTHSIHWPTRDPDSTTRLDGLRKAITLLDEIDRACE